MHNPWADKLALFADLPDADRVLLDDLTRQPRSFAARIDLAQQGELIDHLMVVVEGCVCRYKLLPDGRRQIISYLLPGDSCDVHVFLLKRLDHSVATMVPSRIALVPRAAVLELTERRPLLTRALWWCTMVDEAILREWIVVVGRRTAVERVAHLLWETFLRFRAIGLSRGQSCDLPFTQSDMADTLGLSLVHVNRSVRRLKQEGLIGIEGRRLTILDVRRLPAAASFNPDYLHQRDRIAG